MTFEPIYDTAQAFINHVGDYDLVQYITLQLTDQLHELAAVQAELTSAEARELAWQLLELAEHADRRSRGLA